MVVFGVVEVILIVVLFVNVLFGGLKVGVVMVFGFVGLVGLFFGM